MQEPTNITEQFIKAEVLRRGWTFDWVTPDKTFYRIETADGRSTIGQGSRLGNSSANGRSIAKNKLWSYEYLSNKGYDIPKFVRVDSSAEAVAFLKRYEKIVVKPANLEQSRGVTVDVATESDLLTAIGRARKVAGNSEVLLQQQLEGRLYRLLVIGSKLFAAALRMPPYVVGDGSSTVLELITQKNLDPRRHGKNQPLKTIAINDAEAFLGRDVLRHKVLDKGQRLEVLPIGSISVGGEALDVTDLVDEHYIRQAVDITRDLQLSVCGFDIMVEDIMVPPRDNKLFIIELNSMPGFKLHLYPTAGGEVRDPSAAILDTEFID